MFVYSCCLGESFYRDMIYLRPMQAASWIGADNMRQER